MRLISSDGAFLELRPVAYEFDDLGPVVADDDPDDDWLIVRGHVRVADHREWSFIQPCLTTEEAEDLADWLARAVSGDVAPAATPPSSTGLLAFTEPNLAFSVEAACAERTRIRAHFSHESMPPWKPHHDWPDYHAYFVVLDISTADLVAASQDWRAEDLAFPMRTPRSTA